MRTCSFSRPEWAWTVTPDAALDLARLLPALGTLHAWRVLRSLALWIAEDCAGSPPFDVCGMESLEEQILNAEYDDEIRLPLAVIARSLTPGATYMEVERTGYACLCVAEWVHARGLYTLAASFATASALVTGAEPYAEVAARFREAVGRR